VSPHEALTSASGLRPMSAFVVVGGVVLSVALWVVRLVHGGADQPDRVHEENGALPAYAIAARDGQTIARFVPRFDLELSPRSLWQAHTPRRIAAGLASVLAASSPAGDAAVPGVDELLTLLLPDAHDGRIDVEAWALTARQAQRIHQWIEDGAGTSTGRLSGIQVGRAADKSLRLSWWPEVLLSEEERRAHGVSQAWRWGRRLADGLDACLADQPLEPQLLSEREAGRRREQVWKALMPTAFARPLRGLAPELVLPLRAELQAQGVAGWQMRIAYARDRVYPTGEHELFGSWGFVGPEALEPAPREGLELVCDQMLADKAFAFLERRPEQYTWTDDRPVRGQRANGYVGYAPGSAAPVVESTLDLGLQRFLGRELESTLETHQAAVAMGIVLDVESGEVLAVDSAEAYPIQPFAPVYHAFTCGSTFKVLTMAIALEEGVVEPRTRFEVGDGEYRVVYPDGRASGRVIREAEGALTGNHEVREFFAYSVNAALAQVGLLVEDARFRGYLEELGYGRAPGSGLGPERAGFLPPLPWKYAYTHASLGFGHEIATTLWQHAAGLAAVVRGGEWKPLTLVRGVSQGERHLAPPAAAAPRRVFSQRTCDEVRDMMRLGALEGTGREVRVAFAESVGAELGREAVAGDFDIGTKTGTAQKVPSELCVHVELAERARWERAGLAATRERVASLSSLAKPHGRCYTSSICAFGRGPGGGRELMVLIVVDEPRGKERFGSRVAGPAAGRVLAEALGLTENGCAPRLDVVAGFGATALVSPKTSDVPWRPR